MAEHNHANRREWIADDRVGKPFTVIFTNGDLPTNPFASAILARHLRSSSLVFRVESRPLSREGSASEEVLGASYDLDRPLDRLLRK
jgi:hypothetical protein